MASTKEIEMWHWLDQHDVALKRAYANHVRKLASAIPFRASAISSWHGWTYETFNAYYYRKNK